VYVNAASMPVNAIPSLNALIHDATIFT
jgi:hypothetical protein